MIKHLLFATSKKRVQLDGQFAAQSRSAVVRGTFGVYQVVI